MINIKNILRSILFVLGLILVLWVEGRQFVLNFWLVGLMICQPGEDLNWRHGEPSGKIWYCDRVPVSGVSMEKMLDTVGVGILVLGVVLLVIWYITGPPKAPNFFKKILEKMDNQNPVLNGLIAGLVTGFMVFLMMLSVGYFGDMTVFYLLMILGICAIPGIVGGVLGRIIVKTTLAELIGGLIISLITVIGFFILNL